MGAGARLLGSVAVLLVAAGCWSGASTQAGATTGPAAPIASAPCVHVDQSVDFGPYLIAGLRQEGTLQWYPLQSGAPDAAVGATIVAAEVAALEPGILGGQGEPLVLTPIELHVERVIKGDVEPGDLLVFVEGGTAGCTTLWVDVAPRLNAGQRYVFFLYQSASSDGVSSRLELKWDAWPISDGDVVSTPDGPMSLAELTAAIERVTASARP